jgi:hypothetical protein
MRRRVAVSVNRIKLPGEGWIEQVQEGVERGRDS